MRRELTKKCCICGTERAWDGVKDKWLNRPEIWVVEREFLKIQAELFVCPKCAKVVTVESLIQQVLNAEKFTNETLGGKGIKPKEK